MTRPKIALLGAGNIGGALAMLLAEKELGDLVLIDSVEGIPQGRGLDLAQATPAQGVDVRYHASTDYADLRGADLVIVSAAIVRPPEMDRDEWLSRHCAIMQGAGAAIRAYCPDAFVICISNPLETMMWVLQQSSGIADSRLVGMAGILDSARFRYFLAADLGVSVEDVTALVLGAHGPTMVPLLRHAAVGGVPVLDLIGKGWTTRERLDEAVKRTSEGGARISAWLKTFSAFYAPSVATLHMVEAYLKDKKRLLPCTTRLLPGQYCQQEDVFIGVPLVIGAGGIERLLEIDLDAEEQAAFDKSARSVRATIALARGLVAV